MTHAVENDLQLVFIIGTGRCGSTLVHDMLTKHPKAAFVSGADEHLRRFGSKGRLNGLMYRSRAGASLSAVPGPGRWLVERFAPSEAYLVLDKEVAAILSTPCRDLREADATPWIRRRLRDFFERRAEAQATDTFVHKFTGWPRAAFIHAVFPGARFVHVIRDGRAVANSLVQMSWWPGYRGPEGWTFGPLSKDYRREWNEGGRSFPLLAGLQWKLLIDAFAAARAEIPSTQWLDVRYEDFVEAPREHLAQILAFADIRPSPAFDRAVADFPVYAGRRRSYREELSARDNELLDAALADHLERHGYEIDI